MTFTHYPDLSGQSVFVTGGGSGIGAALVEGFLRQGARVAFADLVDASGLVDHLEIETGARALGLQIDVTDTPALQQALSQAAGAHGPITVLVNNAARDDRHDTPGTDAARWDALMAVNLRPFFFATQAVVPGMKSAGGGVIVNFSSISYMLGMSDYPAYTAAKGAITAMTRGHAREFGPDGIRVNAVAPGWVLTERQKRLWATPEGLAAFLDRQCLKEHLHPADLVDPVLFLASRASRMITGQCLAVDGGVVTVSA